MRASALLALAAILLGLARARAALGTRTPRQNVAREVSLFDVLRAGCVFCGVSLCVLPRILCLTDASFGCARLKVTSGASAPDVAGARVRLLWGCVSQSLPHDHVYVEVL